MVYWDYKGKIKPILAMQWKMTESFLSWKTSPSFRHRWNIMDFLFTTTNENTLNTLKQGAYAF